MNITLEIDGMHCATCVNAIEKKLNALDEVQSATVNLVTETAYIECKDGTPTDILISAVKQAGYTAYLAEE